MVRIRKINFFDKFKLKKMISFLREDAIEHYTKVLNFPYGCIQDILPLSLKFFPESYIIEENKEILGMITISPTPGNPYKLVISRLFLEQDCYSAGKQLLEFVIAKYGAKGATTFLSIVDESYDELLYLFADECGFRQCSCEQLWKLENIRFSKNDNSFFRPFKYSDAQNVANVFNDTLITHFKHSLSKTKKEYQESLFKGLSESYKLEYIMDDESSKNIKAYFSVITSDNVNYILDVTNSEWYDCSFEDILNFAVNQIMKRQKNFNLFVKVKKYTTTSEKFEQYLKEKGGNCIQTQLILVKDFYKIIKEPQTAKQIVLFNSIGEKPVFKL